MQRLQFVPPPRLGYNLRRHMAIPLLHTKLYIPRARPELVPRPRLIERLDVGLHRKLTLISAPAGFGKTRLVTQWLKRADRSYTWLSLDEADNDPARFFTYLVAALQGVAPDLGRTAQSLLGSPQLPPVDLLMTSLVMISRSLISESR